MLLVFLLVCRVSIIVGIDYPGGWDPSKKDCVDICSSPSSHNGTIGDYDYLVLEQLYLPQFCSDLLLGVDLTLSHQNVNPYPFGIQCVREHTGLSIHGLWPNYVHGFPSCCRSDRPFPESFRTG